MQNMTSDQLERKVELALQLGIQNHDAITDIRGGIQDVMAATRLLNEQSELQRRTINELIEAHKLAISRYDVADERLNRIEKWLERYLQGIKNGGSN